MHSLTMYALSMSDHAARNPNNKAGLLNLSDIKSNDLLTIIEEFLESFKSDYFDVGDETTNSVMHTNKIQKNGRFISGWIEYGHYGVAGRIVNVKTKTHTPKTRDDSDMNYLYYCFYIPEKSHHGIALFHKTNTAAVKSVFDTSLNNWSTFKEKVGDLKLRIRPLTKHASVKDWMDRTRVKKVVLERYKNKEILSDLADLLPDGCTVNVTVNAPRGGAIGTMREWIEGTGDKYNETVSVLTDMCDEVSSQTEIRGRKAKTSLSNPGTESKIILNRDVIEMVDGFPKFSSLDKFAQDLCEDLIKDITN